MDKAIPKPNQGTATEIFVELKKEHILKILSQQPDQQSYNPCTECRCLASYSAFIKSQKVSERKCLKDLFESVTVGERNRKKRGTDSIFHLLVLPRCLKGPDTISHAEARNQEPHLGLPHGWQGPKLLGHFPLLFPGVNWKWSSQDTN